MIWDLCPHNLVFIAWIRFVQRCRARVLWTVDLLVVMGRFLLSSDCGGKAWNYYRFRWCDDTCDDLWYLWLVAHILLHIHRLNTFSAKKKGRGKAQILAASGDMMILPMLPLTFCPNYCEGRQGMLGDLAGLQFACNSSVFPCFMSCVQTCLARWRSVCIIYTVTRLLTLFDWICQWGPVRLEAQNYLVNLTPS